MSVKVAVRCRPFNKRELTANTNCVISMRDSSTFLADTAAGAGKPRQFTFDHSFWSFEEEDGHFADQSQVYSSVGESLLDEAFAGYNVSLGFEYLPCTTLYLILMDPVGLRLCIRTNRYNRHCCHLIYGSNISVGLRRLWQIVFYDGW
jgi:hypothetical protein